MVADLLFELLVLRPLLDAFDRLPQHVPQPVLADRLLEEVEGTHLPRFDRPGNGALAADHDDFRSGIDLLQPAKERNAVEVGEHQVGDDNIRPPLLEDLLATGAEERGAHLKPLGFDDHLQPLGHRLLIIDGQDATAAFERSGCSVSHV